MGIKNYYFDLGKEEETGLSGATFSDGNGSVAKADPEGSAPEAAKILSPGRYLSARGSLGEWLKSIPASDINYC